MNKKDPDKTQPLSSRGQKGPDHPRNSRVRAIINWLGVSGYDKETKEYTPPNEQPTKITRKYQPGKTLWDGLQLAGVFLIPLVIFLATMSFNKQQVNIAQQNHAADQQIAQQNRAADQQNALDQQRADILQTYLDDMSNLLLINKLLESKPGDEIRQVARERTLTTLRRLDGDRNKIVLRFLQDARLIGIQDAVIDLSNADLSNDDLSGANLSGTDLSNDDLSRATLKHTILIGTILNGATLSNAFLSNAFLSNAFLSGADLSGADLSGADLSGADLRYAHLSKAILNDATLNGAIMNGINLSDAFLKGAILIGAILSDADLKGADLSYASLSNAILIGAILSSADLKDADLSSYAHLSGAVLKGADLSGARLQGTKYNSKPLQVKGPEGSFTLDPMQWPQEFNPRAAGAICVDC